MVFQEHIYKKGIGARGWGYSDHTAKTTPVGACEGLKRAVNPKGKAGAGIAAKAAEGAVRAHCGHLTKKNVAPPLRLL